MELCNFNLQQYIYEPDTLNGMLMLDMQMMLKIMRDVSRGLAFIHENKKIHRDIKPQNSTPLLYFNNPTLVLYSRLNGIWKIADFGFSTDAASGVFVSEMRRGTPCYRAPELLLFSTYNDHVDIWALGCVFYELICGRPAFGGDSDGEIKTHAHRGTKLWVPVLPFVDATAVTPLANLVQEMLLLRMNRRPHAVDLHFLFDMVDESFSMQEKSMFYSRICTPSRSIVFSVPQYGRNPYFSGRDDVLDMIFRELNKDGGQRCVALCGIGGIGKTQIPLEYTYEHREDYAYVFWISGADHAQLLSGMGEIARTVGCARTENLKEAARKVLQWLRETNDVLIIIDNLDDMNIIEGWLPDLLAGHTIITTRVSTGDIPAVRVEVTEMTRENSIKFLLLHLKNPDPREEICREAGKIVDALDGLPLAIDQAAVYIGHPENIFRYLTVFQTQRQRLLSMKLSSALYNHSVATAWILSFQRLQDTSQSAAELLQYLAFMNLDEIPVSYLTAGATALPPSLQEALEDGGKCSKIVRSLEETGLLRVFGDRDKLRIHRLVQAVVQDRLRSKRNGVASIVVQIGLQAFPMLNRSLEGLQRCRRFRAQVVFSLGHTVTLNKSSDWLELAEQLAYYFSKDGFYIDAVRWWTSTLEIRKRALEPEHSDTLQSMNGLAVSYRSIPTPCTA